MLNLKKVGLVARFEVIEAMHSRLLALLLLLYGGGAMLASSIFLSLLRAAERSAREALVEQTGVPAAMVPENLVQEKAMPWIAQMVEDEATRELLLSMDPLSIFFGFVTLQTVALLVLLGATGSITRDVSSGAARYILFRCDRLSWTLGKAAGQALLLGGGLIVAVLASAAAGAWIDESFEFSRLGWLFRAAFQSWLYGLAYLGIFMGISMLSKTPLRARAGAVLAWFVMAIGHSLVTAAWLNDKLPGLEIAGWLFPAQHKLGLWSGNPGVYLGAVSMLLVLAGAGFFIGYRLFESRDA